METVVLPAQDHLAQERFRQQEGLMSGIIYPLGGLPRTRRKVRSPHQVFVAASLPSDIARSSDKNDVHVADSRSGLVSPRGMPLGIIRSAPLSASTSHLPPSSMLKTPQYRLNNTTPHGFNSHESSSKKLQQQYQLAASLSTQTASATSLSVAPRQILRTRSDGVLGELLQQQGLKRGDDRKKSLEKGVESTKNSAERTHEKTAEKSSDRKKGQDRRPVEKKPITVTNTSQEDKNSTVQKKVGGITILQRPQTKEAAAENIALFTGKPIEDVTKQILKSAQTSQHVGKHSAVEVELVKDVGVSGKGGEIDNVQTRSSTNVSPKKGTKKKSSRDFSGKPASRAAAAAEVVQVASRRTQDPDFPGESRRPRTAPRPAETAFVERRRSDDTERKIAVELHGSAEPDVDEVLKSLDKEFNSIHVSSVDQIVPSWSNDGVSIISGGLRRGSSDSLVGEIGEAFARQGVISRSGSFRDVSRGNDNGAELFLPSSPPKPSERWAGPAYTNSPPPSTLPLPTFPIQRVKTTLTEVTLAEVVLREQDTNLETVSSSAATSPTLAASLLFSATTTQSPFVDPSSATKDLRRMLNLDVEDSFDVSVEWNEAGAQSLKRLLQLG